MILNEKVFIVTGASSGIGEEISKQLALKGAKVVCAARRIKELERVRNSILTLGGQAICLKIDIDQQKNCETLISQSIKEYGKLDGLVLNAGISMWAKFDEIKNIGFFKDLIQTNYLGAVYCVHAALPHLKRSKGKIISCSTGQALMGFPNHSGYVASKHALHGFLSTLAIENKNEITILEAVLSWIRGTNLRQNSFGPSGKSKNKTIRKHTKESVSLKECVRRIINAIEKDKTTVYIPKKLSLIPFLKMFFKNFLDKKVSSAINKNK